MEKSKIIQESINIFKNFPSVGPKTAERFVYFLLENPKILETLVHNLNLMVNKIVRCKFCNDFSEENPCKICSDTSRNKKILCLVEKHQDIFVIESTGYNGLYYILSSIINPLEGKMPKDLNLESLIERIKYVDQNFVPEEIIIATSFTTEGELTSNYISQYIKSKNLNLKITRIARGLPTGAEIEYADLQTLSIAFKNRSEIE